MISFNGLFIVSWSCDSESGSGLENKGPGGEYVL